MLYFNDHCRPGSEWIRFTSKRMFRNRRWTAEDEKQPYTPWLALPGRDNLGLGRFWHFVAVVGWLMTGADLPAGAGHERAVAAARADFVGRVSRGVGSCPRVPASGRSTGQAIPTTPSNS